MRKYEASQIHLFGAWESIEKQVKIIREQGKKRRKAVEEQGEKKKKKKTKKISR